MADNGGLKLKPITDEIVELIVACNFAEIESMFKRPEIISFAAENSWSITSAVLEKDIKEFSFEQTRGFDLLLRYLAQYGKPKEMVFALLECCQAFQSTELFTNAVSHLCSVLLKLSINQSSLDIVCETVYSHVKGISWAGDGEEYKLVESDDVYPDLSVVNTAGVYEIASAVSAICQKLVAPLLSHWKDQLKGYHRSTLVQLLQNLLNYPLLYIFYPHPAVSDSFIHVCNCLQNLCPTLTRLFKEINRKITPFSIDSLLSSPRTNALVEEDDLASIGSLAYLVLCEGVCSIPQVYTNKYKFCLLLPYLNRLSIRAVDEIVNFKTQSLLLCLLNALDDMSIDLELAQLSSFRGLVSYCYWCMQYAELNYLRKKAMTVFKTIHSKLDDSSRASMYRWVLNNNTSPEVLSHTYSLVKDYIHKHWSTTSSQTVKTCNILLSLVFAVPEEGREGDIITDLNKISSAINVAIYLVLRDKQKASPFTKKMSQYIHQYLQPVGKCLQNELHHQQEILKKAGVEDIPELSVEVGGQTVTTNSEMEIQMTKSVVSKLELVLFNQKYLTDLLQ